MKKYKLITDNTIDFMGDLIVEGKKETIVAWVHNSGNVEFVLDETDDYILECIIHKKDLKEMVRLL